MEKKLNEKKISARMNIEPFLEAVTRFTMAQKTGKNRIETGRKKKEKKEIYIYYTYKTIL